MEDREAAERLWPGRAEAPRPIHVGRLEETLQDEHGAVAQSDGLEGSGQAIIEGEGSYLGQIAGVGVDGEAKRSQRARGITASERELGARPLPGPPLKEPFISLGPTLEAVERRRGFRDGPELGEGQGEGEIMPVQRRKRGLVERPLERPERSDARREVAP